LLPLKAFLRPGAFFSGANPIGFYAMRMFIGKRILRIVLIAILLFTFLPLDQHAAKTTASNNFSICAIAVGVYTGQPAAAMVANNRMAGIGLLIILANLFQPQLARNRKLKVLRAGICCFYLLSWIWCRLPFFQK
jgi:hypothetical protein